jgi:glucokinase
LGYGCVSKNITACPPACLVHLQVRGSQVEAAALAVAGAVENNRCPMTNITWVIDGKQLQQQFQFKTAVLNDFEAVGYGIPALEPKDLVALNDVPMVPHAPKVVMGPGGHEELRRNRGRKCGTRVGDRGLMGEKQKKLLQC